MKQMSLSEVCKKYGFTRRVIQGYEKEGLIKHTGKNKYGYLMYDEDQVNKIAYIRYLQINGLTLKEISNYYKDSPISFVSEDVLLDSNTKHKERIKRITKLIKKNEMILKICSSNESYKEKEKRVFEIIVEELKNEKTI